MSTSRLDSVDSLGWSSQHQIKNFNRKVFFAILTPATVALLLALSAAYVALDGNPAAGVYLFRLGVGAALFFVILYGFAWSFTNRLSSLSQQTPEAPVPVRVPDEEKGNDNAPGADELLTYKEIFDDAPVGYHELGPDGRITRVNRTELAMLGYSAEEMIGRHAAEFIHEKVSRNAIAAKLAGEVPLKAYERHFIRKDGSLIPIMLEDRLMRNAQGSVIGIRTILHDRTAYKEVEKALERERDLLYTLMDNIPDSIYFKDIEGRFIKINKGLAELLGLANPDDAVGKTDFDFYKSAAAQEGLASEKAFIQAGKALIGRVEQIVKPNGDAVWVLTTKVPIQNKDGEFTGLVGISKDITERKHAEEALERSLDALLDVMSAVSKGDLSQRGTEGDDTLGRIARAINQMLNDFSAMLTQVRQMGLLVSTSAVQIHAASSQIAIGAQKQTEEISSISSAVTEMAASMTQVSGNANTSADAAKTALDKAALGNKSASDTSVAMTQIDSAFQMTVEKMRLLADRSSKISEVIDLINEIASQTNLLSLNAAIEAAHAGEAGLGFGIVAEEIRKLADRTARATKDVSRIIQAIQSETGEALGAMGEGKRKVEEGRLLAENTSQALNDISDAVKRSSDLIEEISAASEEQARVTKDLVGVMQTVSDITYETSASAQETTSTVEGMVQLSDQLNESLLRFKIKDS